MTKKTEGDSLINSGQITSDKPLWLVVEPYPSEKYELVNWDDDIPNIWENKNVFFFAPGAAGSRWEIAATSAHSSRSNADFVQLFSSTSSWGTQFLLQKLLNTRKLTLF